MIATRHTESPRTSQLSDFVDGPRAISEMVVTGYKEDIRHPRALEFHVHADGQLVYADSDGVIIVGSDMGDWVVLPSHALWLTPGRE